MEWNGDITVNSLKGGPGPPAGVPLMVLPTLPSPNQLRTRLLCEAPVRPKVLGTFSHPY